MKNIYFLTLAILLLNFKIEAQIDSKNSKMVDKDGNTKQIFFTRDPIPYPNSYYTKYLIEVDNVEVYDIGFLVFKELDSISVQLYDKIRSKITQVGISFNRVNNCYSIIKDYHVNDKDINDSVPVSILFNIPDKEEEYVNLNIFKDISDETHYYLENIPPDVRTTHIDCVIDIEKRCKNLKTMFEETEHAINNLKTTMTLYKERKLNIMTAEIDKLENASATTDAPQNLQEEFTKKMDNLFSNQFEKYYSFEDNDIDAKFKLKFFGNGKLQNIVSEFIHGSKKDWFIDKFNQKIKPIIETEKIPTIPNLYKPPDLISAFINSFSDSISYYNTIIKKDISAVHNCDSMYTLPVYSDSGGAFEEITRDINDTFNTFINKQINLPTVYSYNYRYSTEVSIVNGKWKNEKNEFDIKAGLSPVALQHRDEISKAFKEIFAPGSSQRYDVKICTLTINGIFIGVDIQKIE